MNDILAQIVLAARKGNDEFWMQMLVFIVLGVLWAVGGILKARANKQLNRKKDEQLPHKPTRKMSEGARALRAIKKTFYGQPQQAVTSTLETQRGSQIQQPQRKKIARGRPPSPETAKTAKKLKNKHISTPAETSQAKCPAEILLAYDDPEKLKRAILHYEILGKPLSLRDN